MTGVEASLTVTPVGVGAAFARVGEAQSCYLVRGGDTAVCLDLGAGALNNLQRYMAPEQLDAIVISHLHADHCVDLFALRVYLAFGLGGATRVRVIGPPGLAERFSVFAGGDDWGEAFAIESLNPAGGELVVGGLTVRYTPVPHSGLTFALRCDGFGGAVTYSADCRMNDALVELAQGSGVLIAEAGNGPGPSGSDSIHLSGADAGEIARRAEVARLLLTHCFPEHDREATVAAAQAVFSGPVGWATEGAEVAVVGV